jgi:hypothetical protein
MLLCHQLGTLRPSFGLILCSKILQITPFEKFILSPINTALKKATLEMVSGTTTVYLKYSPSHSMFANNDSLEEGSNQLVGNYNFYIYNKLSEIGKIPYKTLAFSIIHLYLDFLSEQINGGKVLPKNDKWNMSFSKFAATLNQSVARNYTPIDESNYDPSNPQKEISEWKDAQTHKIQQLLSTIEKEHNSLCKIMGIS